jgi:hypothetical protein
MLLRDTKCELVPKAGENSSFVGRWQINFAHLITSTVNCEGMKKSIIHSIVTVYAQSTTKNLQPFIYITKSLI